MRDDSVFVCGCLHDIGEIHIAEYNPVQAGQSESDSNGKRGLLNQ